LPDAGCSTYSAADRYVEVLDVVENAFVRYPILLLKVRGNNGRAVLYEVDGRRAPP